MQISNQSGSVLEHAASLSQGADALSQRAEKQAASLEETSAAMEQVAVSAKSGEKSADAAKSNTDSTLVDVLQASEGMENAMLTMEDLQKASQQMADTVDVIDGIAVQTNLLSLNDVGRSCACWRGRQRVRGRGQ